MPERICKSFFLKNPGRRPPTRILMAGIQEAMLARLDALITKGKRVVGASYVAEMGLMASRLPEEELRAFLAGASAAVEHIAGRDSEFFKQVPRPEQDHLA